MAWHALGGRLLSAAFLATPCWSAQHVQHAAQCAHDQVYVQVLLMPEDPNAVLICVATGTGIAPYRSFWHRCFYEEVPNWKFTGLFWLFMGAANSDACLYDYEINVRCPTQSHLRLPRLRQHCGCCCSHQRGTCS